MKTIIVAAGLCTPARRHVRTALQPYGVAYQADDWWANADGETTTRMEDAAIDMCRVLVNSRQARWAEYLLLRTGKLRLLSPPLDARNARWALKWQGTMPKPWITTGCTWPPTEPKRRPWWQRLFR